MPRERVRVLVVGDSLLKGHGGRPIFIRSDCHVIPLPGRKTRDVFKRLSEELQGRFKGVKQVMVHCGSNDIWPRRPKDPSLKPPKAKSGKVVGVDLLLRVSELLDEFPGLEVVVSPVLPREYTSGRFRHAFTKWLHTVQTGLSALGSKAGSVRVGEFGGDFLGRVEFYGRDKLHLSSRGQRRFRDELRRLLSAS